MKADKEQKTQDHDTLELCLLSSRVLQGLIVRWDNTANTAFTATSIIAAIYLICPLDETTIVAGLFPKVRCSVHGELANY